tara:strand:- start:1092 stop:1622 length:531 start_codon:yes stop_codon:yes gene_type:complete
MRKLIDTPNTDAVTTNYPKGRVRDKSGATQGTTYSEILVGDMYQLFQKLVIDAGITENDVPDNVTNGYQLLEALNAKIETRTKVETVEPTLINGAVVGTGSPYTIIAASFDRMIYCSTSGTTSGTDYYAKIGAINVGRLLEADSCSFLLAKGTTALINPNPTGGATVNIYGQKIGV